VASKVVFQESVYGAFYSPFAESRQLT
jgi:hypothetical protein